MSTFRLLLRNLIYHWRGNLAVLMGVILGTAVLTGALLVGDSLRGSLRALALDQLGWVEQGMTANRFFRDELAKEISAQQSSPALILQGSGIKTGDKNARPVTKISVIGVDERFLPYDPMGNNFLEVLGVNFLLPPLDFKGEKAGIGGLRIFDPKNQKENWDLKGREPEREVAQITDYPAKVVLNQNLAEGLKVQVGDIIALNVQKAEAIPRESLLGKRKQQDVVQAIEVKVAAILPDQGMARFTLRPSPEPVRNAFVYIKFLQQKLDLPGRANVLLVAGAKDNLQKELHDHLTLKDWNLKIRSPEDRARALVRFLDPRNEDGKLKRVRWLDRLPEDLTKKADAKGVLTVEEIIRYYHEHRNYFLLESKQMLLEDAVVQAVYKAFAPAGSPGNIIKIGGEPWWLSPTLIYLADSISDSNKNEVPYAVVAAHGPYPQEKDPPLQGNQLDLADWPESPFKAKPGDAITLSYYAPDDHNHLQLHHETFTLRKLFPLTGRYDDPDLVPEFPGITDKLNMANWENPPFPYNPRRVKIADENYWKRYRTTPRAYISLEKAQKLWASRFGKLTSFRIIPMGEPKDYTQSLQTFRKGLLDTLQPEQGGFVFQNVREQGLKAGGGSIDFGEYFLYFSFFLIVAALLLVGLLFRLNLDLRSQEIGVLMATGWTYPQVRRLLLGEGALLAILGSLLGLGGALLYADQLLHYLRQQWPGEQTLNFLNLHTTPRSFAIGLAGSLLVSLLTILWAIRILSKMTPRSLLAGETTASVQDPRAAGKIRWSLWLALGSLLGPLATLYAAMFVESQGAQAGIFFGSGFLMLSGCLALVWFGLRRTGKHSNPRQSLVGLGMRNAGRNAVRSVLTVGLLASATFLIVAVESFHKEAGHEFFEKTGGSGGFPLYAQADVPIFQDLNDPGVREQLPFPKDAGLLLKETRVYPCRLSAGDDASCLNLYKPDRPRILGVTRALIQRGGFSLDHTWAKTEQEEANPWLLLEKSFGDAIPVFADANSAKYILNVSRGDTYEVPDEQGNKVRLKIVGLFHESIFQSELVMAESNFTRLFPRQEGFAFFLIEGPKEQAEQIKSAWEIALADNGLAVESTAKRLENYLAVENTYLSTFQALGGLGLLLGAVGLAIVLLRGVWERRGELALLRALGFRRLTLAILVLAENAFLLLVGLAVGTLAALLAVAPHLAGTDAHQLWLRVLQLLALVIVVGLLAGLAAVSATLRAPLIHALRRE